MSLRAEPSKRAEVTGRVLDTDGRVVPSATVRVEQMGKVIFERQADTQGRYKLSIYPVKGEYDLTASSQEKGNWLLSQPIQTEERKKYDFHLKSAVSIQGSVLMLDQQSPHVGLVVQALKPTATQSEIRLGKYQPDCSYYFDR